MKREEERTLMWAFVLAGMVLTGVAFYGFFSGKISAGAPKSKQPAWLVLTEVGKAEIPVREDVVNRRIERRKPPAEKPKNTENRLHQSHTNKAHPR